MNHDASVVLTGFPERVQRIADAIDTVLPGEIVWEEDATLCPGNFIMLTGRTRSLSTDGGLATAA